MAAAADSPYAAATDLAELLVRDGVPFREAHAVVGALVRRSLDDGSPLADLVLAEPRWVTVAAALLAPGGVGASAHDPRRGGPRRRWPSSAAACGDAVRRERVRWNPGSSDE